MIMHKAKFKRIISELQPRDHRGDSARTVKAVVESDSGEHYVALKTVPRNQMVSEYVAAMAANVLSVPCPEPFLITLPSEEARSQGLPGGFSDGIGSTKFFANKFIDLPSLSSVPMTYGTPAPSWFNKIIVFDILVGNVDRTNQNILIKNDDWCAIDHNQIFLARDWTKEHLDARKCQIIANSFETNLIEVCGENGTDSAAAACIQDIASNWVGRISEETLRPISQLKDFGLIEDGDLDAICDFLCTRGMNLGKLVQKTLETTLQN